MQVFVTEFPVRKGISASDILDVAMGWLISSPHYTWRDEEIAAPKKAEIVESHKGGETVWTGMGERDGTVVAGLRHRWVEESKLEWITEVVSAESSGAVWISVRLFCNAVVAGKPQHAPARVGKCGADGYTYGVWQASSRAATYRG